MSKSTERYGLAFSKDWDSAQIERYMIQQGGFCIRDGKRYGLGLFQHFKNYWSAVWPNDSQTRWTDLILKELLENQFVSIIGPGSSWKTGTVGRVAMLDYSCFPECTGIIVSSTDMRGLDSRIFGEFKMLWRDAHDHLEWWPGNVVDHKRVIATDNVEEDEVRDVRNGIIGVPCKSDSGVFLGLGKYSGFKNRRVWSIGDEFQFMELAILQAQENLISNGPSLTPGYVTDGHEKGKPRRGYKAVFIGNPNPTRPENPLHMVSEPEGGWGSITEDGKTKVWDAKRVPGTVVTCRVISLDGADSPNNDFPEVNGHPKWIHLINRQRLAKYDPESEGYWSQGRGIVKLGLAGRKVVTREMCDQFHAFDGIAWDGNDGEPMKIGMLDAAYGSVGGDRCVTGFLEFGKCVDGKVRVFIHPPMIVPVTIRKDMIPEDQISIFCKDKMQQAGVSPENFFFDGRGSMASSLARIWSPQVNAVEFGGRPSKRPVPGLTRMDETGATRPVLADEHFSKFVTELWFSVRFALEADQIRGMTLDVVMDGAPREYYEVKGHKVEAESKEEMKKRTGRSPDLFDWLVTGVEGARRRGFIIEKLGQKSADGSVDRRLKALQKLADRHGEFSSSKELHRV